MFKRVKAERAESGTAEPQQLGKVPSFNEWLEETLERLRKMEDLQAEVQTEQT